MLIALTLAAAVAGATPAADAEAELALARQRNLYVVVDPALEVVEIKIRGQTYVTLPLADWGLFSYRWVQESPPAGGTSVAAPSVTAAEVVLPATWTVVAEPGAGQHRRVATIEVLRPLDAATEPAAKLLPPSPAARPSTFEVPLASGWVLAVAPGLPATRGVGVWAARLADGWARLRGRAPSRPPLLALALDADAARRLHHVLRPGTAILLRSPAAAG